MENGQGARGRRTKTARPWQRRRRRSLIGVLAIGILLSVWLFWRLEKRAALNEALQRVSRFDVPVTLAEYEARYGEYDPRTFNFRVSEDSPYYAVTERYRGPTYEDGFHLPRFGRRNDSEDLKRVPYADPLLGAMQAYIGANADALAAFHEATLSGSEIPEVAQSGDWTQWLCLAACMRAHEGDVSGAFQILDDGFVVHRRGDRNTGDEAVAFDTMRDGERLFTAMESVLRRVRFSNAQLVALQTHLVAGDWRAQFLERHSRSMAENILWQSMEAEIPSTHLVANILLGNMDLNFANGLTAWCVQRELVGLSLAEQESVTSLYDGEPFRWELRPSSPPILLTVVHTALDIVRYTQDNGVLPESLGALVPQYREEVPVDFWSGEFLRYQVDGRTFAVYSVGRNRKDDGASLREDMVFQTTLPAQ